MMICVTRKHARVVAQIAVAYREWRRASLWANVCECGGGGDACDLCFANLVCECVLCGIARLCLSLCAKWCVFCVLFCSSVSEHIYIYTGLELLFVLKTKLFVCFYVNSMLLSASSTLALLFRCIKQQTILVVWKKRVRNILFVCFAIFAKKCVINY